MDNCGYNPPKWSYNPTYGPVGAHLAPPTYMHIFPIVQILIALYQHFISLASRSNFTRKHPSNGRWSVGTREMRQGCQWPSRWHSTKSPEIWSESPKGQGGHFQTHFEGHFQTQTTVNSVLTARDSISGPRKPRVISKHDQGVISNTLTNIGVSQFIGVSQYQTFDRRLVNIWLENT